MAVVNMTRVRMDDSDGGAWYINAATVADTGDSNTFVLPVRPITGNIGAELTGGGAGTLQFTFGTPAEIAAGTATFTAWNGTDLINTAVTAWKVVSTGGSKTGRVVVKTTLA